MKHLIGFLLSVVLLLAACTNTPAAPTATTTPPPTEAATQPPATATAAPTSTPESAPPTASPPPHNPATLSPATSSPAAETPTAGIPPLPIPLPATSTPTVELGKLPPPPGDPTPEETSPVTTPPAEWAIYENDTYGFRFSYPAERWTPLLQLNEPHGLALAYHEQAIALRMRFSGADEDVDLQLYGGAAGDMVTAGSVHFLGENVERTPLVFRDNIIRVFYNGTSPIPRGDMLFSFALISNRDEFRAMLPEDVQAEADRIIESFVLDE